MYIPQRAALLMRGGTGMSSSDLFMLLREENVENLSHVQKLSGKELSVTV